MRGGGGGDIKEGSDMHKRMDHGTIDRTKEHWRGVCACVVV